MMGWQMTPLPPPIRDSGVLDRKSRILVSAGRAFGASGFKGASLRDIAANAEVSLTLLDHHFGSKEQLLAAVIGRHHEQCRARLDGFRSALFVEGLAGSFVQLTGVWVRHEFDLMVAQGGTDYLRFLVKLMNDDDVGLGVRQKMDCTEPVVLHALTLAASDTRKPAIGKTFVLARGALHAALSAFALERETAPAEDLDLAVEGAVVFIHAGIAASLG